VSNHDDKQNDPILEGARTPGGRADIPRINWTQERIDENPYGYELEKQRALKEWKAQKKAEEEQERVQGLRAEMEAYKNQRLTDWMEHGGDPADFRREWPAMMKDYLDEKRIAQEFERAEKLREAYAQYPFWE
jgi:hypothetical protein